MPSDLLAGIAPQFGGILLENFQHDNIFDSGAAREELGYRYTVRFADGVRRVTEWLEQHHRLDAAETQPWYDPLVAAWEAARGKLVDRFAELRA